MELLLSAHTHTDSHTNTHTGTEEEKAQTHKSQVWTIVAEIRRRKTKSIILQHNCVRFPLFPAKKIIVPFLHEQQRRRTETHTHTTALNNTY